MDYKKITTIMNEALDNISKASTLANVSNINHNNLFKEISVIGEISEIYPSVARVKGTNNADAIVDNKTIELKSSTYKVKKTINHIRNEKMDLGIFEFDKCNTEERVNEIAYGYDMYAFSLFKPFTASPIITLFFHEKHQLDKIRDLLFKKANNTYNKRREKLSKGDKSGRDSCQILGKELLDLCSDDQDVTIFLDGEHTSYTEFIKRLNSKQILV